MEALKRYSGRAYPLDTTKLKVLFKEFKTPRFEEPRVPGEIILTEFVKLGDTPQPFK